MPKIKNIKAYEILNSAGEPALAVKVILDNGLESTVSSTADYYDAPFARSSFGDGDFKRFKGRGRQLSVKKVEELAAPALIGQKIEGQEEIDHILNGLAGPKAKDLGTDAVFALSFACARLGAQAAKQELFSYLREVYKLRAAKIPTPIFNIWNGGDSGDTNLDFQEFLLIPKKGLAAGMIRSGAEVFKELGEVLDEAGYDTDTGQEGGYAPDIDSSIEALEFILSAIIRCDYRPGEDFFLGIDVGSSVLYDGESGQYVFSLDNTYFKSANLLTLYEEWLKKYPLIYLEDAYSERDLNSWRDLTAALGKKMLIAGDDLFSSNIDRLRELLKEKTANTIIIKPSQAGTVTDTINCLKLAQEHGYQIVISARNQESNDDFIVDLAVAGGADYLKAGSLSRGERVAKYNRLLEIASLLEK
jgi:enolase